MKLYNNTKIPDALLKPILSAAARRIGVKSKDIIVKITAARNISSCYGEMQDAILDLAIFLEGESKG